MIPADAHTNRLIKAIAELSNINVIVPLIFDLSMSLASTPIKFNCNVYVTHSEVFEPKMKTIAAKWKKPDLRIQ